MKILFPIGAFYPSQVGGPCNTMYWHTKELTINKIDTSIVTTTSGIKAGEVEEDKKIKMDCGTVFYGKGNPNSWKILRRNLKEIQEADIIHLNSFFDLLSISSFFYSRLLNPNKKIVCSVRGQLNPNALRFSSWKKKPLIFLYKRFSKGVLFHTSSEQETKDTLKIFEGAKTIQIPNFIQPQEKINLETKKQILFVGRIHPIKAIHKLIEGVSLSQSFMNGDYKLILAGIHEPRHQYYQNQLFDLIKELNLSEKVQFKGHIRGLEKEELYAESSVLVLPSETENFGNVVVESLNQGTPVIASKGTPWGIMEDYKCGYHVENSPKDLGEAIDKIIESSDIKYSEMRKQSQRLVMEEFNISQKINNWIRVYNDLNSE